MASTAVLLALGMIRDVMLCWSIWYAFKATGHLMGRAHHEQVMRIKNTVFLYLGLAVTFLLAGFISQDINLLIGRSQFGILNTSLFFISNILFIIAFSYFWHHSSRLHRLHTKDIMFSLGVTAAVLLWLNYLINAHILPKTNIIPIEDRLMLLLNPLSLALAFLLTLAIHPRYKAGVIRTPLWYLSSGVFMYFIGHMMMVYHYTIQESAALPLIYKFLLIISAAYFLFGFFIASKKYRHKAHEAKPPASSPVGAPKTASSPGSIR